MLINKIFVVCKDMKFHHFSQEKYGTKTDNSGKINRNSQFFDRNCHKKHKFATKKIVTEVICNHAIVVYTESHLQEALST